MLCSRLFKCVYHLSIFPLNYLILCIRTCSVQKLTKLMKKAGSVLGAALERRMLHKLLKITLDRWTLHIPCKTYWPGSRVLSVGGAFNSAVCNKDRYRKSFLPTAITLYNNSLLCWESRVMWQCTMHFQFKCTFKRQILFLFYLFSSSVVVTYVICVNF